MLFSDFSKVDLVMCSSMIDVSTSNDYSHTKQNGCSKNCTMEYNPICGTDGNTINFFANTCKMDVMACERSVVFHSINMDFCENTGISPQHKVPELLLSSLSQVSNDQRTNKNEELGKILPFKVKGHENNPLQNYDRVQYKRPESKVNHLEDAIIGHNKTKKQCPKYCNFNFAPVCGKNGHKYKVFTNVCEMNRTSCTNTAFEQTNMNFCKIYDSLYYTIMRE